MKNKVFLLIILGLLQYQQQTYCIIIKDLAMLAAITATPLVHITFTLTTLLKSIQQERVAKMISTQTHPTNIPPQKIKTLTKETTSLSIFEDPYTAPTQEEWDAFVTNRLQKK